jgi:PPM family protein phosphatase
MNLRVGAKTDIGRARERNEDSMLVKEPLFAVADGMGGHRGGDVASAMTLETLQGADLSTDGALAALVQEIRSANRAVLDRGASDEALRGMGTTVTAILIEGDTAYLAHVGDSRAYLLRDGVLQQLTEDHTLVQRMVREGRITSEQAERHPQRSILTKALGVDDALDPYELTLDLHQGDRILLCSDGLTGMLREDRIQAILESEADPQAAADELVDAANQAGGDDNITVIVIDVGDRTSAPARSDSERLPAASPAADGQAEGGRMADTGVLISPVAVADAEAGAGADSTAPDHTAADDDGQADRPGRRRRIIAWLVLFVIAIGAAFVATRVYVSHQWYVGESNGHVAIYRGIPATVLGYELSHVEVDTAIPTTEAERLQQWQTLRDGITAESLEDARGIVSQIEQDLGQATGAAT